MPSEMRTKLVPYEGTAQPAISRRNALPTT